MTPDQMPSSENTGSSNNPRQKIIAGAVVLVVFFLIWQIYGMFSGGGTAPATTTAQQPVIPPPPKAAELVAKPSAQLTPAEIEMARVQDEMQSKYTAALNELQQLKVSQQIAEANQAIMTAKLATVTAEKNIVEVVSKAVPQVAGNYIPGISAQPQDKQATAPVATLAVNYSVISVSQLQYKWHAVLGYNGNLYNVTVGDILPPDGSKVVSINKSGVELDKDGVTKKVSLVPII